MASSQGAALAIGIDLGRTDARVGLLCQDGRVEILSNAEGKRTTPCYVAFTENEVLIGESARYQAAMNPANTITIYDLRRLIGRRFSDASFQKDMKLWPFKVIGGTNDVPMIVVSHARKEKKYFAVEILSMFLKNLKDVAEDYVRSTVEDAVIEDAVITAPPEFYNSQRQAAVKKAGKVAGLNVLQIITDHVAAAYALRNRIDIAQEKNVLIHLGRTALFVYQLGIDNNGRLEKKAFGGDHFVKRFNYKEFMADNSNALSRLRGLCKMEKKRLSSYPEVTIDYDPSLPLSFKELHGRLTRVEFKDLNAIFFSKCIKTVGKCLRDARINKEDVGEVILVGGSTRIQKVRQLLQNFFPGRKLCGLFDSSEVFAIGAVVVAEKLCSEKSQKAKNLALLDTVPLSLGVDGHDGTFSVIVPRNTPIPAKKERIYSTTNDYQESIYFNVYQGERSRAKDNNLLGKFEVAVPLAPRGKSKVKVVFSIDADGILNCWVKELTTGLKKMIIIDNKKQWILKEEIEKMLKDAENYKVEDQRYEKKVLARTALEEYIYKVKRKVKTIRSNDKMIPRHEDMKKIETAIEDSSHYLDRNELADVDEYQNTLNQLEKLCVPIIAQLL